MSYPPGVNPSEFEPVPIRMIELEKHHRITHEVASAHLAGRVTVLHIVDFGETRFLDDDDNHLYPAYSGNDSAETFDELKTIYNIFGQGDHPRHKIVGLLHDKLFGIHRIDRAMPDEVFRLYFNTDKWLHYVRIGNLVISSRDATDGESEARRIQIAQARDAAAIAKEEERAVNRVAELERKQKRLEAIDSGKTALTNFDHAIATVGDRHFHIPTDRASTVLAVRVLQVLAQVPQVVQHVEGENIIEAVWSRMPRAEREMFSKKMDDIIRVNGARVIGKRVLETLRSLTPSKGLGITRETSGERFKLENRVSIKMHVDPLPADADLTLITPIFTSEIPREQRRLAGTVEPIPKAATQEAIRLLDEELGSNAPLSHAAALELLDLVTDRQVKRALRAELKQRDSKRTVAGVTEALRDRIRISLDEGYISAYRARTIAGNSWSGAQGGISLVSGALPGTTKWYIGEVREDKL